MTSLQAALAPVRSDSAAQLVHTFLAAYGQLCKSPAYRVAPYTPDIALPALFDLVMSAKYAQRMITDGGWTYCSGINTNDTPALFFPFLKTCPRCSVKRGLRPKAKANKPGSDPIGEMAVDSTILVLAALINAISPNVVIQKSSNRKGDVDLVLFDNELVVLAEVKSSPLAIYPLMMTLPKPMTDVMAGEPAMKADHSPATAPISLSHLALYVPHFICKSL